MDEIFEDTRQLIASIAFGLQARHGANEGVAECLSRLGEQDLSQDDIGDFQSKRMSACRHLPEVVATVMMSDPSLSALLATVEDRLCWMQNPNYSDEAMGQPGYMDNYAYAELIGSNGLFSGDDFRLGLLLLGPGLFYPEHYHNAPELYWLLNGPSEWQHGAGGFTVKNGDETLWHRPLLVHATKTLQQPLLGVYIWPHDVEGAARLVRK